MKTGYLISVSAASAVALGVGVTLANFGSNPSTLVLDSTPVVAASKQGDPKVSVDSRHFSFGAVERDAKVSHKFRITNLGDVPLELKAGPTTCSACTIAKIEDGLVAAGQSTDVVVEYNADSTRSDFRQGATVLTNDPREPRVELNISGYIVGRFRVLPARLVLSNVAASQPHESEVRILCYLADSVRVVGHEFEEENTASYFDVRSEPLPVDQLDPPETKDSAPAKSASRVLVTLKPGLPLGPFRQTIRLAIESGDSTEKTTLPLVVEGTIVSDFSIAGPGWHNDVGVLSLGRVDSAKGIKHQVAILARGAERNDVEFEIVKVDPSWLQVSLGQREPLSDSVVRIPINLEIPPGRPPAIHQGTGQGKYAEVVLKVKDEKDAREIRIFVKFVIEPSQAER